MAVSTTNEANQIFRDNAEKEIEAELQLLVLSQEHLDRQIEQMNKLREKGWTMAHIANAFSYSVMTVRKRLRAEGLERFVAQAGRNQ